MEQITVDITPDGAVSIDAVGFSGADCEQATRFLEKALGQVSRRAKKPEYWQQSAVRKQTQQLGR